MCLVEIEGLTQRHFVFSEMVWISVDATVCFAQTNIFKINLNAVRLVFFCPLPGHYYYRKKHTYLRVHYFHDVGEEGGT